MLATLTDAAFDSDEWVFEIKWDGYRAVATVVDGRVELESRNNTSFTEKFAPITDALHEMRDDVVLDGEVVALDENGLASFQKLQSWQKNPIGDIMYYVFDLLWLNGRDLTDLTLLE